MKTPFTSLAPTLAAIVLAIISMPSTSAAGSPSLNPSLAAGHDLTATDVDAWLDGLIPAALDSAEVPGAVVVVVKDGQVLTEKGYGYSNYEKRIPVDPRTTLFRPGSTSKLFTWTAVMQQVEQGKLDLDVDVNRYLDFKIPALNGQPVTLRNIMTHTAGFEETIKDLLVFDGSPLPLGQLLKNRLPPRLYAPGTTPAYSNYATALAGYIVERVSGEPFAGYMDRHVLKPLAMSNSTFQQPLPVTMQKDMSLGYATRDELGRGFESIGMSPAGALSTTGDDMAHFMLAHLQDGEYGTVRILRPETARQMHTSITRLFPDLNGMALGFYEKNVNGHRAIGHAGDTNYFHSDLTLFEDDHVGVFISVNALGKDQQGEFIRDALFKGFVDRYFPGHAITTRTDPATAKEHAAMMAGTYITSRGADSTFLSLFGLLGSVNVGANPDGSISAAPVGRPEKYVEVRPFLWQQVGEHRLLQAIVKDGKVTRWSTDQISFAIIYQRPGGLAGTGLELVLIGAAVLVLALTALSWPVVTLIRRHYKQSLPDVDPRARVYRMYGAASVVALVGLGFWLVFIVMLMNNIFTGNALIIRTAQFVSALGVGVGVAASMWNLVLAFKSRNGMASKIFAAVLFAAFAFVLWFGIAYHLIGFSAEY